VSTTTTTQNRRSIAHLPPHVLAALATTRRPAEAQHDALWRVCLRVQVRRGAAARARVALQPLHRATGGTLPLPWRERRRGRRRRHADGQGQRRPQGRDERSHPDDQGADDQGRRLGARLPQDGEAAQASRCRGPAAVRTWTPHPDTWHRRTTTPHHHAARVATWRERTARDGARVAAWHERTARDVESAWGGERLGWRALGVESAWGGERLGWRAWAEHAHTNLASAAVRLPVRVHVPLCGVAARARG
jgi:hypothetical protein